MVLSRRHFALQNSTIDGQEHALNVAEEVLLLRVQRNASGLTASI